MGKFTQIASQEGYGAFKEECRRIFKLFKKYGSSVLDTEFADSDETETKLKKLFIESNMSGQMILEFWNQNYMHIISQVSDLMYIPSGSTIYIQEYLESNPTVKDSDPRKFRLSKAFYQQLKRNHRYLIHLINYTFAIDERYLYIFQIDGYPYCDFDISIILKNKIPLSNIIK